MISPPFAGISPLTMAILPKNRFNVSSTILEIHQTIEQNKLPIQLIREGCLYHYSTYEGRKAATYYHTGFKRKVPIVISVSHQIIAFPTHATTDINCNWIFYHHVESIQSESDRNQPTSMITFRNGIQLNINLPAPFLKEQMTRCLACFYSIKK
ncbi:hypothetical conserved protein [Oceanobacillus iheyensis HTE831]|uniref:Hypothetical conserved protein n=1 Tax=Oceanobacillus iheyensis (strain DSM 14371 / CIP 107618 / JCM 11309 / KCTC 3954 / HTE831) TaxID=221109 RepID=Q8ELA0_OCEIH|nr:competence protein ComK [Oceanobacillus iheyensis]BAC15287.1 hypothetical conserved protein [Oceanobacillus iheyensis HTE831]